MGREVVTDRAGVGHGPGEPVEFRDDEGVAGADSGECLVEAGTLAIGAGEAVVEVDAFLGARPLVVRPAAPRRTRRGQSVQP